LVVAAALLGLGADDAIKVSPPVTKGGVTGRLVRIDANTTVNLDGERAAQHTLNIQLQFEGSQTFIVQDAVLEDVLDQNEQDVLVPRQTVEVPSEHARQNLDNLFRNAVHHDKRHQQHASAHAYLLRFPATIMRARGYVPVMVGKLVREEIEPEASAEAVEVAKGVTFLLTKAERREGQLNLGYEVRIRRGREGVKPGHEPVFAGVVVRGRDGRVMQNLYYGQEVDTRDEYITVVKDAAVSTQHLEEGTLEVCVYENLEELRFEFEVANMPLAAGGK
jgi:hypothetical protein